MKKATIYLTKKSIKEGLGSVAKRVGWAVESSELDDLEYTVLVGDSSLLRHNWHHYADSPSAEVLLAAVPELARRLGIELEMIWIPEGQELPKVPRREDPFGWMDLRYGRPRY